MKYFLLIALLFPITLFAQIENVIVETYYVSDSNDATDTTGGVLEEGSKTYRVYIDLAPGSKIKSVYGDARHSLTITSTQDFFNNMDRGTLFGYQINKSWLSDNTTALDSWITLGRGTKTQAGVLKSEDTDGSLFGGGMLTNSDPEAGINLTAADGLMPDATALSTWISTGIDNNSIFGTAVKSSQFISNNALLWQDSGMAGITAGNKVLVAQLTTKGDISFELNTEIIEVNGKSIFYVATGQDFDTLINNVLRSERVNPFLKYPPECGCKDPRYAEYSKNYACDDSTACKTPVVFGCMDTMACNYNVNANFSVPTLCCYPGYCNDRDLAVVCPSISAQSGFVVFPNPAENEITISGLGGRTNENDSPAHFMIYSSFGKLMMEGDAHEKINISGLQNGLYMIQFYTNEKTISSKTFMKN